MSAEEVYPSAGRNWLAHAIEGGLFMASLALVDVQTLLPALVHRLGGPPWLVAVMPVMMTVGLTIPSLLTAHYVATLGRFHPLLLWTGMLMRLPYLLAGGVLLLGSGSPTLCLATVALTPLLAGLGGSFSATAWPQLLARTVPPGRRASLFAVRFMISSGLGVLAGWLVGTTLRAHAGVAGYGRLYLCAFLGLGLSYLIFACIREPRRLQEREPETGLWENLRGMPLLVAGDERLRLYLATTALAAVAAMTMPFLGIRALRCSGQEPAFLGTLISWQMGGAVLGGLAAGWSGDRYGGRMAMLASRIASLVLFVIAPFVTTAPGWCVLFAAFGAAGTAGVVGTGALQLELLPERGRANRLAVMSASMVPVALTAGFTGAWIWQAQGDAGFACLAAISAVATGASLMALLRLPGDASHLRQCATA